MKEYLSGNVVCAVVWIGSKIILSNIDPVASIIGCSRDAVEYSASILLVLSAVFIVALAIVGLFWSIWRLLGLIQKCFQSK